MTEAPLTFYADPGPLTSAARHGELLDGLPSEVGDLTRIIHGLAVYDVVAPDFYGIEVPETRAEEIHRREIDDILAGLVAVDDAPLVTPRPPERLPAVMYVLPRAGLSRGAAP